MTIEEPDLEKAIRQAGNKLIHVQVSENYRGAPGSGQTRWNDFKKGLYSIDFLLGLRSTSYEKLRK